jgi:hypothetical protein
VAEADNMVDMVRMKADLLAKAAIGNTTEDMILIEMTDHLIHQDQETITVMMIIAGAMSVKVPVIVTKMTIIIHAEAEDMIIDFSVENNLKKSRVHDPAFF